VTGGLDLLDHALAQLVSGRVAGEGVGAAHRVLSWADRSPPAVV
jgi:hypothetical protein